VAVQPHLVFNIKEKHPPGLKSLYALNLERKQEIEDLKKQKAKFSKDPLANTPPSNSFASLSKEVSSK
jgi:hypothetical protein